jgi:hypothetical protein
MKVLQLNALLVALLFSPSQQAPEPTVPPERCETAKFDFHDYVRPGGVAALVWKRPAVFPKPAKFEVEYDHFTIDCPDLSAQELSGVFRIRAKTLSAATRRLGDLYVLLVEGFLYPNITEGYYRHYEKFVLTPSSLTVEADTSVNVFFRNAVIGAKVNDCDLQPVYFEGKATSVSFSQDDKVDVFAKMTGSAYVKIPRLTIDAKNSEIVLYSSAQFPEK